MPAGELKVTRCGLADSVSVAVREGRGLLWMLQVLQPVQEAMQGVTLGLFAEVRVDLLLGATRASTDTCTRARGSSESSLRLDPDVA